MITEYYAKEDAIDVLRDAISTIQGELVVPRRCMQSMGCCYGSTR